MNHDLDGLLGILPTWIRQILQQMDIGSMQELRLRKGQPPWTCNGNYHMSHGTRRVQREDLDHCINMASRYSPWSVHSLSQGYLTAPGGHRIGVCGQVLTEHGKPSGYSDVYSLCIRIARDVSGIAAELASKRGSMLLIGPPGSGKTTLLRDLIRQKAKRGCNISVLDQRCELFPQGEFLADASVDVLWNCPKADAMEIALRVMRPDYIALDEITGIQDCRAFMRAVGCGVHLFATAHARGVGDLQKRPVYRSLIENRIFDWIVILQPDKSFRTERICI